LILAESVEVNALAQGMLREFMQGSKLWGANIFNLNEQQDVLDVGHRVSKHKTLRHARNLGSMAPLAP